MKFIVKIANNIVISYEMIALEGIFIERPSTKFTESQQDMIDYKTIYIHFHYSKRNKNNREVHANITMPIGKFLDGDRMMYIDAGKEQIYYKDIVANPAKAAARINNLILLDTIEALP